MATGNIFKSEASAMADCAATSAESKVLRLESALDSLTDAATPACSTQATSGMWQPACDSQPGDWTQFWLAQYMAAAAAAALCQEAHSDAGDALQLPDVLPSFVEGAMYTVGDCAQTPAGDPAPTVLTGYSAEDVAQKRQLIARQVEYYLSDRNLRHDEYFHKRLIEAEEGWLSVDLVLSCPRMQALDATADSVREALKECGSDVEIKE